MEQVTLASPFSPLQASALCREVQGDGKDRSRTITDGVLNHFTGLCKPFSVSQGLEKSGQWVQGSNFSFLPEPFRAPEFPISSLFPAPCSC